MRGLMLPRRGHGSAVPNFYFIARAFAPLSAAFSHRTANLDFIRGALESFPRGDILQNDVVFLCFTYVFSRRFHNYFLACFETNCPELSSTQSSPRWASSCSSCLGRVLINAQMSGLGAKLNSRPEHYWF